MKYKATIKFIELNRSNAHQGLSREEFNKLWDGKTVECKPPKKLIENGYLVKAERVAKKVEAKNGN